MKLESRTDGWHLIDSDDGTDHGPFATLDAAREFADWYDAQT